MSRISKLIISIILSISVSGALFSAAEKIIEKEARKIYEKRSFLKVLEGKQENFLALKDDQPMMEENLPILKAALPSENEIDAVIITLENIAVQTGNKQILNFESMSNSEDLGSIKAVRFSANLSGNIFSLSQYLNKLQKLPYFIEVSSVNVSSDAGFLNENFGNASSRLSLSAKLYYKK